MVSINLIGENNARISKYLLREDNSMVSIYLLGEDNSIVSTYLLGEDNSIVSIYLLGEDNSMVGNEFLIVPSQSHLLLQCWLSLHDHANLFTKCISHFAGF